MNNMKFEADQLILGRTRTRAGHETCPLIVKSNFVDREFGQCVRPIGGALWRVEIWNRAYQACVVKGRFQYLDEALAAAKKSLPELY